MISRNSITGEYPTKRLEDIVEFLDSMRRPVTESDRRAGQYPYYGANGLQGTIDDFIFDEPLVLLAEDGGHFGSPDRGIAYRVSGKTWVNNHAHVLRPKPGIDLGFLCRVLENYDVTPWVTGTTRGKLTQAGASQIVVPVPPLPDQRRIAEILDKADALRAKRRAALAQLDTLTQSIFLDMFGDPATNPKGWPWFSLGTLLREVTNGMTRRRAEADRGQSIVLRLRDIREGWIDFSDVNRITLTLDEGAKYEVLAGDLLFIRVNGNPDYVGRCALFGGHAESVYFNDHVMRVRVDRSSVNGVFLTFLLNGAHGKNEIAKRRKTSAGQHTINQDGLGSIRLPLPPLPVQVAFARRIAAVETSKTSHTASLADLDEFFASVQHRAFRGEL